MKYTAISRFHSLVVQGGRIGVLSVGIGFVGQGSANMICSLRRKYLPNVYSQSYAELINPEVRPSKQRSTRHAPRWDPLVHE
jgi:hypothetical protein